MKSLLVLALLAAPAAAGKLIKTHVPKVTAGKFAVSDPSADGDLQATALPLSVLPADQRAGETVPAPEQDALVAAPFSGVGVYSVKGKPRLALVPAGSTPPPDAAENTLVFEPQGDAHPIGKDTRWRIWRSPAAPPLDAIALEDAAGHVKSLRYLGPASRLAPFTLAPDVPAFVVEHLDGASGIDDPVTLDLVAYGNGQLASLLTAAAGPRSYDEKTKTVIGPAGAITSLGAKGIEVREVKGAYASCTPGALIAAGCAGTVTAYTWSASGGLVAGASKAVTVSWKGGKVVVK